MTITHVQLGGELTGRSIFGGNRNKIEWWGLGISVALVVILQVIFMQYWWTLLISAVLLALSVFVWTPYAMFGYTSVVGMLGRRWRWTRHRRQGFLDFAGSMAATLPVEEGQAAPAHLPVALGRMRFFEIELWPGHADPGRVLIVRHRRHDETTYSAVFEFRARQAGIQDQVDGLRNHTGWARFQASLARQGSLVRYIQQVSRIVPYDAADHVDWLIHELPENAPEMLVRSYAELVDGIISDLEQNRTWLAVGIPQTAEFSAAWNRVILPNEAGLSKDEASDERLRSVLAAQLRMVISRGRAVGMTFRPLDEARFAAVCRSMQDPDEPLDRIEDADRFSMWLPWNASESRTYMKVQGGVNEWLTKTAIVPRDGFSPGLLPVDQLVPLLTGISPAVIRTVSTHATLVSAVQARAEARQDVTTDRASILGSTKEVSDGTSEAQIAASQQRLDDLQPGSGVHGAEWAMALTIQARTLDELEMATNRIEEAAADANINILAWQDNAHHLAMPMTLPLVTGVQRRRKRGLIR